MGRITCITYNMCIIELFVLFVSLASLVLLDLLKIEKGDLPTELKQL